MQISLSIKDWIVSNPARRRVCAINARVALHR
jgi:hypothetical protein